MAAICVYMVIEKIEQGASPFITRFYDGGPLCVTTDRGSSCLLWQWDSDPRTKAYTLGRNPL
jgi:hypothetical protein